MSEFSFTVGIPRLNEDEILVETIQAIARSSARPIRTIIVDNGDEPWRQSKANPSFLELHRIHLVRPQQNIGCAGGWNLLRKLASPSPLITINADCAVASDTFASMLADPNPVVLAYGFSCFLVSGDAWKLVGEFDEGFFPGYWEDTDYRRRLALAQVPISEWETNPRTVVGLGRERSIKGITHGKHDPDGYQGWRGEKLRWFHERVEANRLRYAAKWGGECGAERFDVPFGVSAGAGS